MPSLSTSACEDGNEADVLVPAATSQKMDQAQQDTNCQRAHALPAARAALAEIQVSARPDLPAPTTDAPADLSSETLPAGSGLSAPEIDPGTQAAPSCAAGIHGLDHGDPAHAASMKFQSPSAGSILPPQASVQQGKLASTPLTHAAPTAIIAESGEGVPSGEALAQSRRPVLAETPKSNWGLKEAACPRNSH